MIENPSSLLEDSTSEIKESQYRTEDILKTQGVVSKYKKDDFIFLSNQPSNKVYIVESGRVKIGSMSDPEKEVLKAILGEGEIFGEMVLAGEERRQDFAVAMDAHTVVKSLSAVEMSEMMNENPQINRTIFQLLGKRIRRAERRLASIILKDARTRIVDFLRELAEERGQKVGFETMIKNHFTHKDIANLTGTSRQTVTTTLNALRDKNIINFDRRRILIRDLDLLV